MSHSSGLSFKKIDLHVHTPASTDYQGTKPTADQIVQKALAVGLSAIAITDHQTAASVDQVIAAGKAAGLVVFPGVELMATGGEKGIHINLLFDVDKTSEWIHQFLNSIEVYSKDGKPTVIAAEYGVGKVAEKLAIYDPTAIIVLAHCHSSKGVLGDMKGETRSLIFQKHRKNILAAETSQDNFTDDEKRKQHKRVVDVLDGTDKDYFYRKLGVIQASDAHSLDAIGSAFSWFKVDDPITIEDLRQCFIDRDTRIRQGFEYAPTAYPHIESLAVTDGFLKDQTFTFHEGLNSILGAKGSGKSLAIEALRFALDQAPAVSPIREDHQAKLAKCVKPYGAVIVTLIDESGKRYRIKRTYNPTESHPTEIADVIDGTKKAFSVPEVFPVLFLSQNEIIRIAEEPSGASLRAFIDRFFDFHHHQHQIEQILKELEVVDRRVAEGMRAHLGSAAASRKAATLKEEIEKLNRQLTNPTFEKFAQAEAIGLGLRVHGEFVAGLEASLTELEQTLTQQALPTTERAVSDDPGIKRARDAAEVALKAAQQQIQQAKASLEGPRGAIGGEIRSWETTFAPIKQQYESLVKAAGGGQGALDQRRRKLVLDLAGVERQIAAATTKIQLLRTDSVARQETLTRLDQAYVAYFNERSERCRFFTTQAHGSIDVSIAQGRDVSQFRDKLLGLKKGSYMRDEPYRVFRRADSLRGLAHGKTEEVFP